MRHWRRPQSDVAAGTSAETVHPDTELLVIWALQKQQSRPHFDFAEEHLSVPEINAETSI
jgi:hypothetical protein